MRYVFLVTAAFMFSLQVQAQEVELKSSCTAILQGQAEQGADYKPGVDVKGNPVKSADLEDSINKIEYPIKIPVEIDVIQFLELELPAAAKGAAEMEAQVAYFTVHEDGRIEYNGQDVSSNVAYSCSDELDVAPAAGIMAPAQESPEESGGQAAPDPVASGESEKPETPGQE